MSFFARKNGEAGEGTAELVPVDSAQPASQGATQGATWGDQLTMRLLGVSTSDLANMGGKVHEFVTVASQQLDRMDKAQQVILAQQAEILERLDMLCALSSSTKKR